MNITYCLPIIESSKTKILEQIEKNQTGFQLFEIWLDYVVDLNESFIKNLVNQHADSLIFVLRRKNLEQTIISEMQKREIIEQIAKTNVLLDLDINDQKNELAFITDNQLQVKTVISYHNYQETPSNRKLVQIINHMRKFDPEIIKISTMCNTKTEAVQLLQLVLKLQDKKQKSIILGMGQYGVITRIFGTLWGNAMVFAPVHKHESSAQGQLTRKQLAKIFKVLHSRDAESSLA